MFNGPLCGKIESGKIWNDFLDFSQFIHFPVLLAIIRNSGNRTLFGTFLPIWPNRIIFANP